jgi:hypothetical protein
LPFLRENTCGKGHRLFAGKRGSLEEVRERGYEDSEFFNVGFRIEILRV